MGEILGTEVNGLDVPSAALDDARARLARIGDYTDRPVQSVRLTLRHVPGQIRPARYVADATVLYDGRLLAAHVSGATPAESTDTAVERLRSQLRRVSDADVALRNDPRVVQAGIAELGLDPTAAAEGVVVKPPDERRVLRTRTYVDEPRTTYSAIADLLDDDLRFLLFVHARTNEDVVVHRVDEWHVGLLFGPGSALADEGDEVVVPEPSRFPDPIPHDEARAAMDVLDHGWLYFVDADDGRGKVIYLRTDGDYGLVEPQRLRAEEEPPPDERSLET